MKQITTKFTLLLALVFSSNFAFAAFFITPKPPTIDAPSFILMDYDSSKIIASKAQNAKRSPASLTKLMTAYVAFKRLNDGFISLDDEITISKKAWKTGGSRSFLKVGTKIKLKTLLKGMIVQSGNDASVAIAEHIAGSEGTFVALMNQYARSLGMDNSNFETASGLPHPNQLTTSYDIALLAQAIIKEFPEYYKWFSEKYFVHNNIKQLNRNGLLRSDKTVDGLKTGHTKKAGYCLATSAKRVGMRLISVVLGASSVKSREAQAKSLLDYGFRFFETQKINLTTQNIDIFKAEKDNIKVGVKAPVYLTLDRGKFKFISKKIKFKQLIAPVKAGDKVGDVQIIFTNNDTKEKEIIAAVDLIALENVKSGGFFGNLIDTIKLMF
jgi:D-alanyl-D-alanine carboxypeptidase (penicillin-binding protein 5/6)